jgi:phage I-like protein
MKKPFAPAPVYLSEPIDLIALADGSAGALPTEFRLLESGTTKTTKGDILCDAGHAAGALTQLARDGRDLLPIDYDHDMVSMLGSNKKAAGWFKLEARNGALWATNVTWTPAAAKALSEREYRYFSPALFRDDKGFVTRIINVALTNLPATLNQAALVASENEHMDPETLAAEVEKLKTSNAALLAATATLQADLAASAALVAASAAEKAAAEKSAFIAKLSQDGKLAPALHAWAATQDLTSLQAYAAAAPVATLAESTTTPKTPTADSGATILSDDEKKVCTLLGVSEADFLATKKTLLASGNVWAYDPNSAAPAVKDPK